MVDIKINKVFVDSNTGKDIYVVSIKIDNDYHNINLTKEQFDQLYDRLRSIHVNNEID